MSCPASIDIGFGWWEECELEEGHDGNHRATLSWVSPPEPPPVERDHPFERLVDAIAETYRQRIAERYLTGS